MDCIECTNAGARHADCPVKETRGGSCPDVEPKHKPAQEAKPAPPAKKKIAKAQ